MSSDATYDGSGGVDIGDAPGWRYLPFEGGGDEQRTVTVERRSDGFRLQFTVPAMVLRGSELGVIARVVIGAQERVERSEGLGG
jgi:hypothetical protein